MATFDRQVHGYQQGHQLLAASTQLSKLDQSTVDQLSDISGPLRPKEQFDPYISAYPLPSGQYYVLAKTWQDLSVPRAGCVRTLSVIVPIIDWCEAKTLAPFFKLLDLDRLPEIEDAVSGKANTDQEQRLPEASGFKGSELIEALFLEEPRPIVVFDARDANLVAMRLLTSMWPMFRRRFSLSTFALSPRKVNGRDFDLVFAPKDAKAKYSDWVGRRIDGGAGQNARHPWTSTIANRVFEAEYPKLLSSLETDFFGSKSDGDDAVALRVALSWSDLVSKLKTSPTAALGLLDIANSGKVKTGLAFDALKPALEGAVKRATNELPESEAWDFLIAIANKLKRSELSLDESAVGAAVESLSARAPDGAVSFMSQDDQADIVASLAPRIANGLGNSYDDRTRYALLHADRDVLALTLSQGGVLAERLATDTWFIEKLGQIFSTMSEAQLKAVRDGLLPYLIEDWQFPAAKPLVDSLDQRGLVQEAIHLGTVNGFKSAKTTGLVIRRALENGCIEEAREAITNLPRSNQRNRVLSWTLTATSDDVRWLLNTKKIPGEDREELLLDLLHKAGDEQLLRIFSEPGIGDLFIRNIGGEGEEILARVIRVPKLPVDIFVQVVSALLSSAKYKNKDGVAEFALERCLRTHFPGDEMAFLVNLLQRYFTAPIPAWIIVRSFSREVEASVASRNMVALSQGPLPLYEYLVNRIVNISELLRSRSHVDLNAEAVDVLAGLLEHSLNVEPQSAVNAAGLLLPRIMWQKSDPVSPLVAAAFPIIYQEIAREDDDVPNILKFVPFYDWDRCKTARRELVYAFMSSKWPPSDLALTAWRCRDTEKILARVAKSYRGEEYIDAIQSGLKNVPADCRKATQKIISALKSGRNSLRDWHD